MFAIKKTKAITPFDETVMYPLAHIDAAGPLLKRRLRELVQVLEQVYGQKDIQVWLFGSQLRGKSAKNQPDIDVYFYHPCISAPSVLVKNIEVIKSVDFKVDLAFCDMSKRPCAPGHLIKVV